MYIHIYMLIDLHMMLMSFLFSSLHVVCVCV